MDCNMPGSSVYRIFQATILEWVATSFSRGIFPNEGSNPCLLHWQVDSLPLNHQGSPLGIMEALSIPSVKVVRYMNRKYLLPTGAYVSLFLKQYMRTCSVARQCPTLFNPMDCSPQGSSVHGVLRARTLEWVAISSSRGSSRPGSESSPPASPALAATWEALKRYRKFNL